jgi:crotonobetainyl-CoA:carnitine CoA-transferase CaiB-like acyl-CoA transferase
VQCETGLVSSTGTKDLPAKAGLSVADIAAGMYAYSGILTALYVRERTGRGDSLHVAMLDALGEWMSQPAYFSRYGGEPPRRTGARHPSISPYGPHRTRTGSAFFGVQNDREWTVFCRDVLLRPELTGDPRFVTNGDRVDHNDELTAIIEAVFADLDVEEVLERIDRAGIANARLRTPAEFTQHPQLAARQRWCPVDTPGGVIDALLPPVMADSWEPVMGVVPALGAHNEAIRSEFAPGKGATP